MFFLFLIFDLNEICENRLLSCSGRVVVSRQRNVPVLWTFVNLVKKHL